MNLNASTVVTWLLAKPRVIFSGSQVSCLTQPPKVDLVRDNSIKCTSQKDGAFSSFPTANPGHCLKSAMIRQTAVDWTLHWGESGPSAQTHPDAPASSQWQALQADDWEGGRERESSDVNVSFIRAPRPAPPAVWKHNCNENPIDCSRFLSDKLHCFLSLSVLGRRM